MKIFPGDGDQGSGGSGGPGSRHAAIFDQAPPRRLQDFQAQ